MITTDVDAAKQALIKNEVVAIPTETVYGLAANAFNESAIKKIFSLKNRPFYNPLIVHIKSVDFLSSVAYDIPEIAKKLATEFWPGPLTLILKKLPVIPDIVTAGKDTVGVRMPNHPLTLSLLQSLEFPLAAPSANPFGSISSTTALHVYNYFKNTLPVILDGGECEKGLESTIIGFENNQPVLYRLGAVSIEDIEKVIGKIVVKTTASGTDVSAPGMLSRHYAPKTKTCLTDDVHAHIKLFPGKRIALLLFKDSLNLSNGIHQEVLSPSGNMAEAARDLYAAMHRLDTLGLDVIIAERFPDSGIGKTINDRLQRAVAQ